MDLSHKFEDSPKLFGLLCKSVTGRARPRVVAGPWNVRGNSELFIVYRTHIKSTKKGENSYILRSIYTDAFYRIG